MPKKNAEKTCQGGELTTVRNHPTILSLDTQLAVSDGQVAQLVEHCTENAGVAGSIPALTTSQRFTSLTGVNRFFVSRLSIFWHRERHGRRLFLAAAGGG